MEKLQRVQRVLSGGRAGKWDWEMSFLLGKGESGRSNDWEE